MSKLDSVAESLKSKYIRQGSRTSIKAGLPKRGVQAEINKIDAIKKALLNYDISRAELVRLQNSLQGLSNLVVKEISASE